MATFETSYHITETMEGGYSNHPSDKGKETYAGISRASFPNWEGWKLIDKQPKPIKRNTFFSDLAMPVRHFYRANFWLPLQCGLMPQVVANQLFDYAVNSGKSRAVKSLQSVLNSMGAFLKVDGIVGAKTQGALKRYDANQVAEKLLLERETFINRLAQSQPQFKNGWLNRIAYLKSHLGTLGISFGVVALLGLTLFF